MKKASEAAGAGTHGSRTPIMADEKFLAERDQIITRLIFVVLIFPWMAVYRLPGGMSGATIFSLLPLAAAYLAVVFATYWDLVRHGERKARLYLTSFTDCVVASICIWITDVQLSPLFFLYLFVIIGNTVRYGRNLMMFTTLCSFGAYTITLTLYVATGAADEYGHIHWPLESGKLLAIVIIPVFLNKLIRRMARKEECIHQVTENLKGYTIGEDVLSFGMSCDDEVRVLADHLELLSREIREKQGQLAGQTASLQQQVRERTAELKTQMEKAQEADRLKTEFLNTISHELRTPLNSIIGFTDLLRRQETPKENADKMLSIINAQAHSLVEKIEKLTSLTLLISGKVTFAPAPMNVQELVRVVIDDFREKAADHSLEILSDFDLETNIIIADAGIIHKTLAELVSNAVKFSPAGKSVRVSAVVRERHLVLRVADDGPGIGEEYLQDIFELFRQMDGGLDRQFEGMGAGLYIVKLLVSLHHGSVNVSSRSGEGATFEVVIPVEPVVRQP